VSATTVHESLVEQRKSVESVVTNGDEPVSVVYPDAVESDAVH
jgi:hypothetical protein